MTERKILEIQGVTVSFDNFKVLDGLDFSMNYGEVRFLIGPNGAGKTTLLDIITSKTAPSSGKVIFDGHLDVTNWVEHKLVRHGIARKFQTPSVFSSLTVYENVEAAISFRTPKLRLLRPLNGEQRDKVESVLEMVGLQDRAHTPAEQLSHGEKQWLEIAMLLIQEPKLMLLDEPVAGMSRAERDRTGELLHRIGGDRAVLVIEHDMVFVRQFASIVTVLHMGSRLCEGPVEEIQNDPEVIEVYLGRGHKQKMSA
ncbi:MAG: urea ABC transporter ATP-binding protein UrtD [Anaerolineaceae bacterium]|nr:urea ABC transporter ATP-binding protein UrtD [Anaerolineaceae bacterium]